MRLLALAEGVLPAGSFTALEQRIAVLESVDMGSLVSA